MSEILPRDILLRAGGKVLQRHGVLAVAGPARGLREIVETFTRADGSTCARLFDRNGVSRLAAANVPRIEWVDLDGDGIRETPGLLLEGTRTNVVLHNRDLTNGAWTPTNMTVARNQLGLDGVAATACQLTATAGNATVLQAITLGSSARYQTAYVKRVTGTGTIEMTMDNGSTWTPVTVTNSVAGAFVRVSIPTQTLANPTVGFRIVTSGDSIIVDFVQNENGVFPSSPIAVAGTAVTRAADNCTVPCPFGPMDLTVMARIARPVWADVAGDIGLFPGIVDIGNNLETHLRIYGIQTARQYQSSIAPVGTDAFSPVASILAGADQTVVAQFSNLATAGVTRIDVGGGFGSNSAAAAVVTAFGSQVVRLGGIQGATGLYGVLIDVMIARGLFTHTEMRAAAV